MTHCPPLASMSQKSLSYLGQSIVTREILKSQSYILPQWSLRDSFKWRSPQVLQSNQPALFCSRDEEGGIKETSSVARTWINHSPLFPPIFYIKHKPSQFLFSSPSPKDTCEVNKTSQQTKIRYITFMKVIIVIVLNGEIFMWQLTAMCCFPFLLSLAPLCSSNIFSDFP